MSDFTFDRFLEIPRLSGLQLSPDGSRLIVSVGRPSADGKKLATSIWEVDPGAEVAPRRLTRSEPGESDGVFLRDGSIAFTSKRPDPDAREGEREPDEEINALWLLPPGGGEARVVAAPKGGVQGVRAAREADWVAFAAAVHPGSSSLREDGEREAARKKAGVAAQLFEAYPIRFWDHYLGPRERHLFAAAVPESTEDRFSDPLDLTLQPGHLLNETDFDITPDGGTVVTGWRNNDELTRPAIDLVAIDRRTGERRTLTGADAWYGAFACSPDGRSVACTRTILGTPTRAEHQTLWLVDLGTGDGRDLTPDLDLWPQAPAWAADSSAIFFTADRRGHTAAFRLELESGALTVLAADGAYGDLCPTPDGDRLYALRSSPTSPPRVVRLDARAADQVPQTIPSPVMPESELELPGIAEEVIATAPDGHQIRSWLVRPRNASAEHPSPLLLWVHGGPTSSWVGWHWRWNPHLLVQRGYAILLPDPALSTGYGHEFLQRGWGRWGAEPYADVMAAVDAAVERPEIDASRIAAMGGSFGGYMANWIAGQTDRFRAIVTHASLWELRGFHGTTDFGSAFESEFGDPYTDPTRYEEHSPSRHLDRIVTPMLVIHGELDHRVPISEALRLWTDLRRHGVDAKFLYFPDENHWIQKPPNSRLWYETAAAFLDQHVLEREWRRPELL